MDLSSAQTKMQDAITHLKGELSQIRTGRANASLVSDIICEVYNTKMMVKELAQISTPEPAIILISPFDKSIITNVVGGIAKSNIGLNGVIDGDIIRIVIPPLSTERREEFVKQMHGILEKYRVQVRQVRHETREELKAMKESGTLSEDEEVRQQEQLQKLHDEYIDAIEVAGRAKEEELRQI